MKQIKLKPDPPFHNSVDVAVIDFPKGLDGGEERQRCKVTAGIRRKRRAPAAGQGPEL